MRTRCTALALMLLAGASRTSVADDAPIEWENARRLIAPSVVRVEVTDASGDGVDEGSGFFVSKEGTVVTSRHLFRRAAAAAVVLHDGTRHEASGVRAADPGNDLVLLAVSAPGAIPVAWGDSEALSAGSPVAMLSSAPRAPQPFTTGTFVRRGFTYSVFTFLETTAAMEHGLSGSPVFDPQGRVVGLGAARLDWENPSGLSIPAERVKALVDAAAGSSEVRPFGTAATFLDAAEWAVQNSAELKTATAAAAAGDDARLVSAMEAAVAKHPKSALALYGLAGAQSRTGDGASAVVSLQKALALSPAYLEVAVELAETLARLGRHEEAVAAYRRAMDLEPRDLSTWFGLGTSLVRAGRFDRAVEVLERLTQHAAERPEVWAWLGSAFVGAKRLDDARAVVERLRPDHPEAAARLAAQITDATK